MLLRLTALAVCLTVAWAYENSRYSSRRRSSASSPSSSEIREFATCAKRCTEAFQRSVKTGKQPQICKDYPKYERCVRYGCGELGEKYFKNKIEHDPDFDALERKCERGESLTGRSRSRSRSPSSSSTSRFGHSSPRRSSYDRSNSRDSTHSHSSSRGW